MVQDSFAWFTGLVAERRKLPIERVRVLADGRVYTGRQAVAEKLIDELGGEDKARRLAQEGEEACRRTSRLSTGQSHEMPAPRAWAFPWPIRCLKLWALKASSKAGRKRELDGLARALAPFALTARRGGRRSMIKSELVQKIADKNPHLYHRDVERIVNTILDQIIRAMKDGDRVELRGFGAFSVKSRKCPHRPQSAHRRRR